MLKLTNSALLRVLVADSNELILKGLSTSLNARQKFQVVALASDGAQTIDYALQYKPDILVLDLQLPDINAIDVIKMIKRQLSHCAFIVMSNSTEPVDILCALAAGANACCSKNTSVSRLLEIIEMVQEGAVWIDPKFANIIHSPVLTPVMAFNAKSRQAGPASSPKGQHILTKREEEVLQLMSEGKSNQEIADILCITIFTVKAHVSRIIHKLNVNDRTQAVVRAFHDKIVVSAASN